MRYLFEDVIALKFYQIFPALLHEIHVALNMWFGKILWIGSNWVITEMDKFVPNLFGIIICSWESYVAFIIYPNSQWVKVCSNDPLADVEFSALDDKRVLYIFLSNPLRLFSFHVILNLDQIVVCRDTSTSRQTRRF